METRHVSLSFHVVRDHKDADFFTLLEKVVIVLFNLAYSNNGRKDFQQDCPKSVRSIVAIERGACGVRRANQQRCLQNFGENLKEV